MQSMKLQLAQTVAQTVLNPAKQLDIQLQLV